MRRRHGADNGRMNASFPAHRVASAAIRCALQPMLCQPAVKLLFVAALCSVGAPSIAAGPANAPTGTHPISGQWTWTLPGKACTETLQYRTGGKRLGSSGEEVTESEFQITPLPGLLGFYRLVETVTQSNGKPDCAGDLHEALGNSVTRFIQLSPRLDQMIVCREESLKACFGPLKRVPG